jgi:hypothetical protein
MDRRTHGLIRSKPPQTFCGLPTKGLSTTTDPFQVTCDGCIPVMEMMGELPNLSGPVEKRGRGRPSEESKKKGWFS